MDDLSEQVEQDHIDRLGDDKVYDTCRDNGDDFADLKELFGA
jgi:hypothetical protein